MLQSRVNQDSPTTSRALRNSGRTSSTPGALPPRSFLTTSATSAPEIGGPTPESPGPASLPEGAPSPPYTVLTMHCFPLLRRRMVVQNLFEAVRKSFSMASPNSSHVRVFASVTATAALRLACRYLPAASGVPQAKKFDGIPHRRCPPAGSGIAATAGTDHLAATALVGRLNNGGVEHGPLGLNVPRLPRYMVKALPEVGVEALSDRRLCQTFPADPHDTFGSASSAPLFARVSKTCGRKSDDTTTKSIIELRPRVSWCQAQTTVRIRPPTRRRREATLSSTGVNSNTLAPSRGAISIATPARRLSPVATPEWKRVQPLSRRLVPEPLLCVEVRPTISSRNFSTSRTSSGSFPTSEVTFHVPRASFCSRGSDRQGPRLRPPPSSHCTRPLWPLLLVVSRREGGPTSSFRAVPGRAPPGHQALAAEPHPQAWLQGEAPGNVTDIQPTDNDRNQSHSPHVMLSPRLNADQHSISTTESMIALKDLPLLQRKEFKIHGGQIGDNASDISYNNISKQIDLGLKEKHTEGEIARAVFRIIKPGNFKDMLSSKDEMTIAELKSFLQSHLGEKSSTELFQELMNAKQHEHETPQQFLYRTMGLKQKGLNEKHDDIRHELRPLLSDPTVTDEMLLRQVTKTTNEESERKRRLGRGTRPKAAHVQSSETNTSEVSKEKCNVDTNAKDKLLHQLSAQVQALTEVEVRPLSELLGDRELDLTAANGEPIPYDGWVDFNLPGNDDPNLAIRVPFLVSQVSLARPIVGFNVIKELILGQEGGMGVVSVIARLLKDAMQVESDKAEAIVNFIQTQEPTHGHALVRVGWHELVVHPGQVARIKCKVPADFTSPVALFEVNHPDLKLEQLDLGDGLVEVHHTRRPYVEIAVGNHTQQNIKLDHFTVLGSIQPIDKIVETDQADSVEVNVDDSPVPDGGEDKGETDQLPQLWHPSVDRSHLNEEQQELNSNREQGPNSRIQRDRVNGTQAVTLLMMMMMMMMMMGPNTG
ncbi:hypothetical protein N1851_033046 [Merluccius polli]|uniref:Uncharacterized protein n=1 Tax=Merluccius polli TaxID=89951 RepID=A0AA47M1Y8_MERPO|nr:hypothetical protein N1851_033046 [Merluccius polli]